jgi:hypothetical protein
MVRLKERGRYWLLLSSHKGCALRDLSKRKLRHLGRASKKLGCRAEPRHFNVLLGETVASNSP